MCFQFQMLAVMTWLRHKMVTQQLKHPMFCYMKNKKQNKQVLINTLHQYYYLEG